MIVKIMPIHAGVVSCIFMPSGARLSAENIYAEVNASPIDEIAKIIIQIFVLVFIYIVLFKSFENRTSGLLEL